MHELNLPAPYGGVAARQPVVIEYDLTVGAGLGGPVLIVNEAEVDEGTSSIRHLSASVMANGRPLFLSLLQSE